MTEAESSEVVINGSSNDVDDEYDDVQTRHGKNSFICTSPKTLMRWNRDFRYNNKFFNPVVKRNGGQMMSKTGMKEEEVEMVKTTVVRMKGIDDNNNNIQDF
mmetsp:Transcript_7667/g.9778  ORF Transcript_7667/g.9778 Transcript_7667/m.9778 type:complete len:102 (-) Transcript_7667:935-1240(-)